MAPIPLSYIRDISLGIGALLFLEAAGFFSGLIASKVTKKIRADIQSTAEAVATNIREINCEQRKTSVDFAAHLEANKIKSSNLAYLTRTIGYFEFALFSLACVISKILWTMHDDALAKALFAIAGGWMAIKVIGNYESWSDKLFGRASFYSFLIGTIINIGLAIGSGFVVTTIVFVLGR